MINKFSIINGATCFSLGIIQNYLAFMSAIKYIKCFHYTARIYSFKSNGMSEEIIVNITKSGSNFASTFAGHHSLPNINFNGHYLMKNKISLPNKVINLFILYTLDPKLRNSKTDFTLSSCLFGSVKLTKNADPDKYKHNFSRIGFDSRSEFLFTDGNYEKNVIILVADMSSSVHVDKKGKYILIAVERSTQRLNYTLTAEAKYLINFTQSGKRFVLSLHYNGSNIFVCQCYNHVLIKYIKYISSGAKDSEIKDYALFLGDVQKILQLII